MPDAGPPETTPLQLVLDDAELTAATALLLGTAAEDEVGEVVEVGKVRLQARRLIGPVDDEPVSMDHALVALVGTLLRAQDSLAVGLRRRAARVEEVSLSFHRLGEMTVEQVSAAADEAGSEVHSLTALPRAGDAIDRVLQLVIVDAAGAAERPDSEPTGMSLEMLERVRVAVAAGDDEALENLSPELAYAISNAEIFGQVIRIRDGEPTANLSVLSRPGEVWSFLQPSLDQAELTVQRVSPDTLRREIEELWL